MVAYVALIASALGLAADSMTLKAGGSLPWWSEDLQVGDEPGRKQGAALFAGRYARSVSPRVGIRKRAS